MLFINKKRGETPLVALEIVRKNKKLLKKEKISYIGRLDPMAEGEMILLVGNKENKNRSKYLNFNKEYEATFLVGISTDSGDIMGFLMNTQKEGVVIVENKIKKEIINLKKIKTQKYPWFSGKTIKGKKMFDIYKDGETDNVKRPTIKIKIHKITNIKFSKISKKKLESDIFKVIPNVRGEFRQKEILEKWKELLLKTEIKNFQTFSFKIKVSSGTFIRGFCENLEKALKMPVLLYKLKRTKIFSR
ncbi:MAG: tRNA pseudouridine synthase B [Parcubacteria group bacterium GW2011_GWF2_38_76]|nr:MAG: tRNA pseudouridine synthase B [Parcubacteria group bacterium GW2011_GWF2_38_76]HBM45957.1 hypothetical protein [Patescibacteria group bacterium]